MSKLNMAAGAKKVTKYMAAYRTIFIMNKDDGGFSDLAHGVILLKRDLILRTMTTEQEHMTKDGISAWYNNEM